jgi:NTP pyrophosphatase (non-canonical NTP hydrolase)
MQRLEKRWKANEIQIHKPNPALFDKALYSKKIIKKIAKKIEDAHKRLNRDILFGQLILETTDLAIRKGWVKFDKKKKMVPRNFSEQLMLVVTELAEALEEYRNHHGFNEIYFKDGKPEGIPIEMADVIIRIAHICGEFGINVVPAIRIKMAYNETRPYRHGGKKI